MTNNTLLEVVYILFLKSKTPPPDVHFSLSISSVNLTPAPSKAHSDGYARVEPNV